MGHESVETTKSFYAFFEVEDLSRKHDQYASLSKLSSGSLAKCIPVCSRGIVIPRIAKHRSVLSDYYPTGAGNITYLAREPLR